MNEYDLDLFQKVKLVGYEQNFQEQVQVIDDKYKDQIHDLMTQNTELRFVSSLLKPLAHKPCCSVTCLHWSHRKSTEVCVCVGGCMCACVQSATVYICTLNVAGVCTWRNVENCLMKRQRQKLLELNNWSRPKTQWKWVLFSCKMRKSLSSRITHANLCLWPAIAIPVCNVTIYYNPCSICNMQITSHKAYSNMYFWV